MTAEWPHEGPDPYHRPLGEVIRDYELRLRRQDEAILTMATWLVRAQTFRVQDARGIEKILDGDQ